MSENRVKETPCAFYADSSDGKFQLNQYTTKKTLGQGAFGVVYLAVNAQTGEEYVSL
jgi:serine/threonine protein kinase